MITPTKEFLEEIIRGTCPHCKDMPTTLRWQEHSKEFIHETRGPSQMSFRICMATHLRVKYKDVLNG